LQYGVVVELVDEVVRVMVVSVLVVAVLVVAVVDVAVVVVSHTTCFCRASTRRLRILAGVASGPALSPEKRDKRV